MLKRDPPAEVHGTPAVRPRAASGSLVSLAIGAGLLLVVAQFREGRSPSAGSDMPHALRQLAANAAREGFTARALSGREVRYPQDFAGKLLLLDFWATWCPPCVAELPYLREAEERFGGAGLAILGVSLDGSHGISADQVRRFSERNAMTWDTIYDDAGGLATRFGVTAIPAPFLIRADTGEILARGDALRDRELARTLEKALGQ